MAKHDGGYKLLFSHPEMVADLLRGFLHEAWTESLDLGTLERVRDSYVLADLRERRGDMVWRARWTDPERGWCYLYFLMEFQSTPDPLMGLRLLDYVALLLLGLIRSGDVKLSEGLPPILSIVLYNGKRPWGVPLDLTSLFRAVPPGCERYQPQLSYVLVDENRLPPEALALPESPVATLFQLETCAPEDVLTLAATLARLLPPSEDSDLRHDFGTWLSHLLRRLHPGAIIPEVVLVEDMPMLEETLRDWLREGREAGRQEGQVEGMRRLVLRQLGRRFGTLPQRVRQQVTAISSAKRLEELADQVLVADSLQAMGLG
ncbi:MAG TPA: Rpn family recombination-promoting nuclease/putative transposase [Thermoanaerobaculia bacterium]|nr:Rpn family recombination-promoting nuclease/putative transposase [Thermoanaerobaculia bacterium]